MAGALATQVALVTGGGRGIGRAIAEALTAEGAAVCVMARSEDQVADTVGTIEQAGGRALVGVGDVADEATVRRVVAETERQLGPVDLLVHSAGAPGTVGPLWETDPTGWWEVVESHVRGMFLACHAVLPGMVARGRGRIITIASTAAYVPSNGYLSSYAAAKAAQVRLTEVLAAETRGRGVSAFAIHPGAVRTGMTAEVGTDSELGQAVAKWLPGLVQLFAQFEVPVDRAVALCLLLASGKADALSGRMLNVMQVDPADLSDRIGAILEQDLYTMRLRA